VIFPHEGLSPRHPSQLYEAFGEGLLPLVWVLVRYPRRLAPGRLAGEFLLLYAVARIVCEAFREAEDGHILGLTAGQFWTLPLAAAGLWLVWRARRTAE
jgi:phosphatidylglycerol:prolipoprotein diacylglycerol transferase